MIPKETGERIYPKYFNQAYKDHRNRYYFATNYINENDKILDISCGCGYGSWFMAETTGCRQVVGVDISDEALDFAQQYYSSNKIAYKKGNIEKNEYDLDIEEQFNVIVSFETIEHLKNDDVFLQHLHTFLDDDGVLIVSSPNEEVIPYNNNPYFENGINPYHYRHYTSKELEIILNNNGFEVVKKFTQFEEIYLGDDNTVLIFVCKKK